MKGEIFRVHRVFIGATVNSFFDQQTRWPYKVSPSGWNSRRVAKLQMNCFPLFSLCSLTDPASVYQKVNLPVPLACEQNGTASLGGDGDTVIQKPLTGSPVFTFPGGVVSHNTHIKAMIEVVYLLKCSSLSHDPSLPLKSNFNKYFYSF